MEKVSKVEYHINVQCGVIFVAERIVDFLQVRPVQIVIKLVDLKSAKKLTENKSNIERGKR